MIIPSSDVKTEAQNRSIRPSICTASLATGVSQAVFALLPCQLVGGLNRGPAASRLCDLGQLSASLSPLGDEKTRCSGRFPLPSGMFMFSVTMERKIVLKKKKMKGIDSWFGCPHVQSQIHGDPGAHGLW